MALALEHAEMSTEDMAAELGVSGATVRNYLAGRTRPTRPHPLFAGLVKAALNHQKGSDTAGTADAGATEALQSGTVAAK